MSIEIPEGYEAVEIEYYKSGEVKRVKLKKVEKPVDVSPWKMPPIPYIPQIPWPQPPPIYPSDWWQQPHLDNDRYVITPNTNPPVPRTYGLKMSIIYYDTGDIFSSTAEVIVNPVNCVGVSGAGLAAQFKDKYPDNYAVYRNACQSGILKIGSILYYQYGSRKIINFPTKLHWKNPSQLEYIDAGLQDLCRIVKEYHITSLAIPPLGCGLGGLQWRDVESRIDHALSPLTELHLYRPVQ